jgi:hypothetical protein
MKIQATLLAILCGLVGCDSGILFSCDDTVKGSFTSPNGTYIATVYERDCGATTDFTTHVNLRTKSAGFKGGRNVVFVSEGKHAVGVEWQNDTTLRIECADCAEDEIYGRTTSWKNVAVSYPSK